MSKLQDKPPVCQNYEEVRNGGSLTEAVKYYFANGIRIAKRTSALANAVRYTHSDHLGSASVMTDASGNVIQKMGYTPFGSLAYSVDGAESVVDPSTTGITNYTFTGQESDWDTGLLYYNARYYDPELGRFITGDPSKVILRLNPDLSIPERLNPYMYCLNNPVMYTDPTGLEIYVLNRDDQEKILQMIEDLSKDSYYFDENNALQVKEGVLEDIRRAFDDGSEAYATIIKVGIEEDKSINISIGESTIAETKDGKTGVTSDEFVEKKGGGVTTQPFKDKILVTITGRNTSNPAKDQNGDYIIATPAEILLHELAGHAVPMAAGVIGNAVEIENVIRDQLQLPLREEEPDHSTHIQDEDK